MPNAFLHFLLDKKDKKKTMTLPWLDLLAEVFVNHGQDLT